MTKEQNEINSDFQKELARLIDLAFYYSEEYRKSGSDNGLAYNHFGRCISCLMGVKNLVFMMDLAEADEKIEEKYMKTGFPQSFPVKDGDIANVYMKEMHVGVRFLLFQHFFSQTEFTLRVVQRGLYASELNRNPFQLITEKHEIWSKDFVNFVSAIRNTIHNNGFYFPSNDPKDFEFEFKGTKYLFQCGKPIDSASMKNILEIIEFMLSETNKLFNDKKLGNLPPII